MSGFITAAAIGGGTKLLGGLIGGIVNAYQRKKAEAKAENMHYDEMARQDEQNRFSREIARDQAEMNREQFEIGKAVTGFELMKGKMQQVADLVNKNENLRDRVLSRWSI